METTNSSSQTQTQNSEGKNKNISLPPIQIETESEGQRKIQGDSTSVFTSSSEDTERSNKDFKNPSLRKFDTEFRDNYKSFSKRSRSTKASKTNYKKTFTFDTVEEEKIEEEFEVIKNPVAKFKKFFTELHDNLEDSFIDSEKKKRSKKSARCLSMMDPVVEVKEDIDFNHIRMAPFNQKIDVDDDRKIHSSLRLTRNYDTEEAILEDKMENEPEIVVKKIKRWTVGFTKINDEYEFYDKTEKIEDHVHTGNIIIDTIKEDPIHENEYTTEFKFKSSNSKYKIYNVFN